RRQRAVGDESLLDVLRSWAIGAEKAPLRRLQALGQAVAAGRRHGQALDGLGLFVRGGGGGDLADRTAGGALRRSGVTSDRTAGPEAVGGRWHRSSPLTISLARRQPVAILT